MQKVDLEYLCTFSIIIKTPITVGETPKGIRKVMPIGGGTVSGEKLNGEILEGGADWQLIREDGAAELEAHYQIKTEDGVIIYFKDSGLRVSNQEVMNRLAKGELVEPTAYYFRTTPKFEAPKGKYEWLNQSVFVGKGSRLPDRVLIEIWRVL